MNVVGISFAVYTLLTVLIGIWSARYSRRSSEDFLLANRGLGAWVAALSASASAESGWVTLGLVGAAFQLGVAAYWIVPGTLAAFAVNWLLIGPRLRARSAEDNALTVLDVLAARFPRRSAQAIRLVGILILLVMLTLYVAAQLNAAGITFSGTFAWPYAQGVLLGGSLVLLYTVVGGFRAIAWTDVVQALLMIGTMTWVPLLLLDHLGGWSACRAQLSEMDSNLLHPFAGNSGHKLFMFVLLWFGIPFGNPGQPHLLVRLMATRDPSALRRGAIISLTWIAILFTGAVSLGVLGRAYFGVMDRPEEVLPRLASTPDLIPPLLGGMIIAAILAAISSTADSQLLVAASSLSHDFVYRFLGMKPTSRTYLWDRVAVVCLGLTAIGIALSDVRSVFTFVLDFGWAGMGASFGTTILATLYFRWTSGWGVLSGMLAASSVVLIWPYLPDSVSQFYKLIPAVFVSFATLGVVSLLTPGSRQQAPAANPTTVNRTSKAPGGNSR